MSYSRYRFYDDESDSDSWDNESLLLVTDDVDIQEPIPKKKTFHEAIKDGDLDEVKAILAEGFKVDELTDYGGWTGLMYACSLGEFSIVQFLIESGANVNLFNCHHYTALMATCRSCCCFDKEKLLQCLNILVENGADINATDSESHTPLIHACSSGNINLVEALLNLKCDVDIQDSTGWSALFYAVFRDREDIVRALIGAGARVDFIDKRHRSAYDLANIKGYRRLAELVCSKKDKRRLLREKELLSSEDKESNDLIEELLIQLPSINNGMQLGYSSEVRNLLWAVGLGHFTRQFCGNNVQLNEFLLMTDDRLIKLGIKFSVHRQKLLNSIRKFHLHRWNKASLGMKPRYVELSIEDGINLVYNVTKHLHVLNATIKYVKMNYPSSMPPVILNKIENSINQLNLINRELTFISRFASQLNSKEKIEHVDLIKQNNVSKTYKTHIIITIVLVSYALWRYK